MSPIRDEMSFLSAKSNLTHASPSTATVMPDATSSPPAQSVYSSVPKVVVAIGDTTQAPSFRGKVPAPPAVDAASSAKISRYASNPPPAGSTKQVPPFPGALPPSQSSIPPLKSAPFLAQTTPTADKMVLEKESARPQTGKSPSSHESSMSLLQTGVTMAPFSKAPPNSADTKQNSSMETLSASKGKNLLTQPPKSAPAQLTGIMEEKKPTTPSSVGKSSNWGFGIKSRMTKWLNPDATTADIGESMQAYYDEKRKVWVFPGEDPEEKAKPIGPPPTALSTPKKDNAGPPPQSSSSLDPLAAMMAPPPRAPSSSLRRSGGPAARPSPMMPSMMRMPPGAAGAPTGGVASPIMGGPPPQFMIFKPAPMASETKEVQDGDKI